MRVADALGLEKATVDRSVWGYAVSAHFDFVVTDDQTEPLFIVELDGHHAHRDDPEQVRRDRIKDSHPQPADLRPNLT